MKPLIVLLASFGVSLVLLYIIHGQWEAALSGRIAISLMLAFTAIGHFVFTKGMAMMLPAFMPMRKEIVYLTGVIEIAAAVGLLVPGLYRLAGWLLIVFFILMLPANIYAAVKRVDYQKGTYHGPGTTYLWFRVPLQLLFIGWTYCSALLHG